MSCLRSGNSNLFFLSSPGIAGRTAFLLLALLLAPVLSFASPSFRIGFSSSVIGTVNENDAVASVRIWAQAMVAELNIAADPQVKIYQGFVQMENALRQKEVDCLSLTTGEFFRLRHLLDSNQLIIGATGDSITEEYLLLVRQSSNITTLADLRGKKLKMPDTPRAGLASVWLDTLLIRNGFSFNARFFNSVDVVPKMDKAVLPVFFGQADACVITRKGFETMAELNPQIGRQLKILATSPAVVPAFLCFRRDYSSEVKEKILREITRWHLSPPGRQLLTIFQTDSIVEQREDCLRNAMALLTEHASYTQAVIEGDNSVDHKKLQ